MTTLNDSTNLTKSEIHRHRMFIWHSSSPASQNVNINCSLSEIAAIQPIRRCWTAKIMHIWASWRMTMQIAYAMRECLWHRCTACSRMTVNSEESSHSVTFTRTTHIMPCMFVLCVCSAVDCVCRHDSVLFILLSFYMYTGIFAALDCYNKLVCFPVRSFSLVFIYACVLCMRLYRCRCTVYF